MMKRVVAGILVVAFLVSVSFTVYLLWPYRPKADWVHSPETLVIQVDNVGLEIDVGYIPNVQIWGDGHIIWTVATQDNRRCVMEGHLSQQELAQIVAQLLDAGVFKGYRYSGWGLGRLQVGWAVSLNLSEAHRTVWLNDHPALGPLVNSLKSGAGVAGSEFIPASAYLLAYPIEVTEFRDSNPKVDYHWSMTEFGYGLESVSGQLHGLSINGKDLTFAWEVVNSLHPFVESDGKVYWIAVVVPQVSLS